MESKDDSDMTVHFDGSCCEQGSGSCIVFLMPQEVPIPYSFKLDFPCTNNNAKYEALILSLKMTIKFKFKRIKIIRDSSLVVNQIKVAFQCK